MQKNKEIAKRLHEFGLLTFGPDFGWKKKYAEELGITQGNLQLYLSGDRIPGNKLQQKLRELGCDIEWLMTGKSKEEKKLLENQVSFSLNDVNPKNIKAVRNILDMLLEANPKDVELAEQMLRRMLRDDAKIQQ